MHFMNKKDFINLKTEELVLCTISPMYNKSFTLEFVNVFDVNFFSMSVSYYTTILEKSDLINFLSICIMDFLFLLSLSYICFLFRY